MKLLWLAIPLLLLPACSPGVSNFGQLQEKFNGILVADLDAALADAKAHNDVVAEACYTALKKYVGQAPVEKPEIKGAISAYQKARDLNQSAEAGVPVDLKLGCSAMAIDAERFLIKMAAMATPAGGGFAWLKNLWPF